MIARLRSLLSRLKLRLRHLSPPERYRPEEHYMRGPGPKTKAKLSVGMNELKQ